MKHIYILQVHTGTFPSIIIKFLTRYRYSHILISLDDSLKKMYSFGRKKLYNPFNAGFVIENIDGDFFKRFDKTKCRIYRISVTKKQYNKVCEILKSFENDKDSYKYDILGLIFKCFHLPITREKYYVCSQFVAEILQKAEIYNFSKPFCLIKPKDFEHIVNAEEIYSGLLKNKKSLN